MTGHAERLAVLPTELPPRPSADAVHLALQVAARPSPATSRTDAARVLAAELQHLLVDRNHELLTTVTDLRRAAGHVRGDDAAADQRRDAILEAAEMVRALATARTVHPSPARRTEIPAAPPLPARPSRDAVAEWLAVACEPISGRGTGSPARVLGVELGHVLAGLADVARVLDSADPGCDCEQVLVGEVRAALARAAGASTADRLDPR